MIISYSNPWPDTWVKKKFESVRSTKSCRKCGCEDLILFRTRNYKRCSGCRRLIYWPLTEGQKPLL